MIDVAKNDIRSLALWHSLTFLILNPKTLLILLEIYRNSHLRVFRHSLNNFQVTVLNILISQSCGKCAVDLLRLGLEKQVNYLYTYRYPHYILNDITETYVCIVRKLNAKRTFEDVLWLQSSMIPKSRFVTFESAIWNFELAKSELSMISQCSYWHLRKLMVHLTFIVYDHCAIICKSKWCE